VQNNDEKHIKNNHATEASRGTDSGKWPVEEIIKRGYALATGYYGDLEPDYPRRLEDRHKKHNEINT